MLKQHRPSILRFLYHSARFHIRRKRAKKLCVNSFLFEVSLMMRFFYRMPQLILLHSPFWEQWWEFNKGSWSSAFSPKVNLVFGHSRCPFCRWNSLRRCDIELRGPEIVEVLQKQRSDVRFLLHLEIAAGWQLILLTLCWFGVDSFLAGNSLRMGIDVMRGLTLQ